MCTGGARSCGISNGEAAEAVARGGHDPPAPPGSAGGGPPAAQPPSAHQVPHCSCLLNLSSTIHKRSMLSQCKLSSVQACLSVSFCAYTYVTGKLQPVRLRGGPVLSGCTTIRRQKYHFDQKVSLSQYSKPCLGSSQQRFTSQKLELIIEQQ